jgi:CelD/BcsL family acetyltransferase involved in cellulose biosynthesis
LITPELATHVAAHGLQATTLVGLQHFLNLEREWRQLLLASASTNPFLSWAWVSRWVRKFSGDQLVTVVVRRGSRTVAVAPFHRKRYLKLTGVGTTALQLFGPSEAQVLFEVREILADPAFKPAVFAALLGELERVGGWDWLEFSAQGADVQAWDSADQWVAPQLAPNLKVRRAIPVMKLAPSWDEHKRGLKRNIKESIRHSYNSLERSGHTFSVEVGECHDTLDRLFELHRLRSLVDGRSQHGDHFRHREFRSFLGEGLAAAGAQLYTLRIDGQVAAVRAALDANGQRYLYYSGFDPAWWKYGVMTLLVTEMVRDAIARGLESINFSPGVDVSKTRWGAELVPFHSYFLLSKSPTSAMRRRLLELRDSPRRRARQLKRVLISKMERQRRAEA